MGVDTSRETAGRKIVRANGAALLAAMAAARAEATPEEAEIVACECVVLAETKDHQDWSLLSRCAERYEGKGAAVLRAACAEVERQEDAHLYQIKGWCRELWIHALGMTAIFPPPEEIRKATTAVGAARAEQVAEVERTPVP